MKKEKTVRTYQRRTKSGKMVTVREHKASYDAAEEARKAAAKKAGAGTEFVKKKTAPPKTELPFTPEEFKEWYHWDMEVDAKNESALKVEKALKSKMGTRAYKKYLQEMTDSYTARGHNKAHKALMSEYFSEKSDTPAKVKSKASDKSTMKPSAKTSSTTSTTGAGADWSKATVDKIGREYGGGYTIVGTPNDSLWSSTNFRTKSQALDFIKRKQKESSAKEKESSSAKTEKASKTPIFPVRATGSAASRAVKALKENGAEQNRVDGNTYYTHGRDIYRYSKGTFVKLSATERAKVSKAIARKTTDDTATFEHTRKGSQKEFEKQGFSLGRYSNGGVDTYKMVHPDGRVANLRADGTYKVSKRASKSQGKSSAKTKESRTKSKNGGSKKPLSSYQKHAINTLLNQSGWTMSKAEKYVRTLSDKEVQRLAHKDM